MGDTREVRFIPISNGWLAYRTYKAGDSGEMVCTKSGTLEQLVGEMLGIWTEKGAALRVDVVERENERLDFRPVKTALICLVIGIILGWAVFHGPC